MIDRASVSRARNIIYFDTYAAGGDSAATTIDRCFESVGWKASRHNKPIVKSSIHTRHAEDNPFSPRLLGSAPHEKSIMFERQASLRRAKKNGDMRSHIGSQSILGR